MHKNIFILLFFSCFTSMAQPGISWQRCIGGSDDDDGIYVSPTSDGGYVITGSTFSSDGDITGNHGMQDVLVARFDSSNNLLWLKTYGGSSEDAGLAIFETGDLGFIVAGFTNSNDGQISGNPGEDDVWIFKIDASGNLVWEQNYGGSEFEFPFSIIENNAGNFVVLGATNSVDGQITSNHGSDDFWLFEISPSGTLLWEKTYGGSDFDRGYGLIQTLDGGYMLSGFTYSDDGDITSNQGEEDIWLVKTNPQGAIQWQKTFGGTHFDYLGNILQIPNGNYVFAGTVSSADGDVTGNAGGEDYWLVEINSTGGIVNQQNFGGSGMDEVIRLIQTTDGGYAAAGYTSSNDGDITGNHGFDDFWIVKTNAAFDLQWQVCLGGSADDNAIGIAQLPSGDFLVTGYTFSPDGNVTGQHGSDFADLWAVRLTANVGVSEYEANQFGIFPNPVTDYLNVSFKNLPNHPFEMIVYNTVGEKVWSKKYSHAGDLVPIELKSSGLPPGVYQLSTVSSEGSYSSKFVLH